MAFEPWQITVEGGTGETATAATFSEPGEYVLRARADNWDANDSAAATSAAGATPTSG